MKSIPKMACPRCGQRLSKVIPFVGVNHRVTEDGGLRRSRECLHCHTRYGTIERVERLVPNKSQHVVVSPS